MERRPSNAARVPASPRNKNAGPLNPGMMLAEYRIDGILGSGGFGITYRAQDTYLDMSVAIKEFFPPELVQRAENGSALLIAPEHAEAYQWWLSRFIGEGQILAQFKHPNIVRVSRYFQSNHTAYIVMEYEEGQSLDHYLRTVGSPISEAQLRAIFIPILKGLDQVHHKKYLHRDIKPGNIYIRKNATPLLLDFGAAKLEMATARQDPVDVITRGYAPIEQYTSRTRQGAQTDLYALGATVYRCITGQIPVESVVRRDTTSSGESDPLTKATNAAAGKYSAELLATVDWMMKVDPEQRPRTVQQVLMRLDAEQRSEDTSVKILRRHHDAANHKLVITGPVGSGKSSAIAALSDKAPLRTDSVTSDTAKDRKRATTVAMDYGVMELSGKERIHLYGTPGQKRFDFMWEILRKGGLGLILLIDNTRRDPFRDLDFFLHSFRDFIDEHRVAIGVTRMNIQPRPTIRDYHRHLTAQRRGRCMGPPIFEVDARDRQDIAQLVRALLYCIDPGVEDYDV